MVAKLNIVHTVNYDSYLTISSRNKAVVFVGESLQAEDLL